VPPVAANRRALRDWTGGPGAGPRPDVPFCAALWRAICVILARRSASVYSWSSTARCSTAKASCSFGDSALRKTSAWRYLAAARASMPKTFNE